LNIGLEADNYKNFADSLHLNHAITQGVSFSVSPSTAALSHIKPASSGTIGDMLMYKDKKDIVYLEMNQDHPFLNPCIQGFNSSGI
jgi:hypothetical protein